jgi:putative MATE family efflux protein
MKTINENSNAITEGVIWKQLLAFFFPVLLGILFQQLYNTVDTIIVGRFVGKVALAAVGGSASHIVSVVVGFFTGVSSGASVIISQYYGAKDEDAVSQAVHTAMIVAIACGAIMTVLGLSTAQWLLDIMGTPDDTMADSLIYIKVIYMGMIPSMIFNMGSATLRAVGDSKRPLFLLIVCCFVNIVLDILFVIGFSMGVMGAAVATVIAQATSAVLVCIILFRSKESYRLELHALRPNMRMLGRTIRIGLPAGIQTIMYGISNMIITAAINGFGTDSVAAFVAMNKIDTLNWMTLNSLGVALMTFAGQNYGANKLERVRNSLKTASLIGLIISLSTGVIFIFCGRYMLMLFTSDTTVLQIAVKMMFCLAPWYFMYAPIEVFSGCFRGLGDTLIPTLITAIGVCLVRVIWIFTVVPQWHQVLMVCICYPVTWFITSCSFFVYYRVKWRQRLTKE